MWRKGSYKMWSEGFALREPASHPHPCSITSLNPGWGVVFSTTGSFRAQSREQSDVDETPLGPTNFRWKVFIFPKARALTLASPSSRILHKSRTIGQKLGTQGVNPANSFRKVWACRRLEQVQVVTLLHYVVYWLCMCMGIAACLGRCPGSGVRNDPCFRTLKLNTFSP
ncbi:hypothetical protein VTK26DRAFT_5095 [Humicola hyalothermophila]